MKRTTTRAAETSTTIPLTSIEKALGHTLRAAREHFCLLTPREAQVAELMADGKPNRLIAEDLAISPKTLDIHRANLMRKLEARTTAGVANLVNVIRLAEAAKVTR